MQTGDLIGTVRVKPWSKDQGDFVEINGEDFDPAIHKPFTTEDAAKALCDASTVRREDAGAEVDEAIAETAAPAPATAKPVRKPVRKAKSKK